MRRVVKLMRNSVPDMKSLAPGGYTPLHCAIKGNLDSSLLHLFIEQGAELNAKTVWGKTPLDVAIVNHQVEWMIALHLRNAANGVRHPFDLTFEHNLGVLKNQESVLRCLKDWGVRAPTNGIEWWGALIKNVQSPAIWMLMEDMGVNFDARDQDGTTWIHKLVQEDMDDFTHIPGATASTILTTNNEGDSPLDLFVSMKSQRRRFPQWMSSIFKKHPSLLDAEHPRNGRTAAFMWIQTAGSAKTGLQRLTHMIAHGWTPTNHTMVPILRDAIECQDSFIVQALIELGGAALVNAPLNSKGCPPLMRATYWLSLGYQYHRIACNGVWVSLLQGGAVQDVSFGGMSMYDMVRQCGLDTRIEWSVQDPPKHGKNFPWARTTANERTLRHLWSIERLQRLWTALLRIVRVLPCIRSAQRLLKQRYYAPGGPFERVAAASFRIVCRVDASQCDVTDEATSEMQTQMRH